MVDYAKKTVAELQEILKSRSLSHTGKKAELVARLNEADEAAAENGAYSSVPTPFDCPNLLKLQQNAHA
jgi:SAP domain-containing ribonucleoprotein